MFSRTTNNIRKVNQGTTLSNVAPMMVPSIRNLTLSSIVNNDDEDNGEPVQRLAVLGAGLMGRGIAHVGVEHAKAEVTLIDTNQKQLDQAVGVITKQLGKMVEKGKLDQDGADQILSRLSTTTDVNGGVADQDMVIEAVSENVELKEKIFSNLAAVTDENTVLATNTSSISITRIAAFTGSDERASKVVGMHFFNPVPVMPLLEVIPAMQSSEDTIAAAVQMGKAMNKAVVPVVDSPGFVVNRILCPYINEAINVLAEGIATVEDIDKTMKLGTNVPMGPLTLADYVGLDTMLSVMRVFHREFGDDKYRASPLLTKYVDAGYYGVKSGRGFYDYTKK